MNQKFNQKIGNLVFSVMMMIALNWIHKLNIKVNKPLLTLTYRQKPTLLAKIGTKHHLLLFAILFSRYDSYTWIRISFLLLTRTFVGRHCFNSLKSLVNSSILFLSRPFAAFCLLAISEGKTGFLGLPLGLSSWSFLTLLLSDFRAVWAVFSLLISSCPTICVIPSDVWGNGDGVHCW